MVRVELKGYAEAIEIWGDKPVRKAALSALRKVTASALTIMSSDVRAKYNIKKSDLDKRVKVDLPKGTEDLIAVITLSGYDLPLAFFNPTQFVLNRQITRTKAGLKIKTMRRSAKFEGVEVEVEKGKRTQLKSAFLMNMRIGRAGVGVMRRLGANRLPTQEKGVISIASMAQNANVSPRIVRKVQDQWDKVFPHEMEFQISQAKKV